MSNSKLMTYSTGQLFLFKNHFASKTKRVAMQTHQSKWEKKSFVGCKENLTFPFRVYELEQGVLRDMPLKNVSCPAIRVVIGQFFAGKVLQVKLAVQKAYL